MFGVFSAVFIISRVIIFPYYCIIASCDFFTPNVNVYEMILSICRTNYRYVNNGGSVPFWNFSFFWVIVLYIIFLFWTYLVPSESLSYSFQRCLIGSPIRS